MSLHQKKFLSSVVSQQVQEEEKQGGPVRSVEEEKEHQEVEHLRQVAAALAPPPAPLPSSSTAASATASQQLALAALLDPSNRLGLGSFLKLDIDKASKAPVLDSSAAYPSWRRNFAAWLKSHDCLDIMLQGSHSPSPSRSRAAQRLCL